MQGRNPEQPQHAARRQKKLCEKLKFADGAHEVMGQIPQSSGAFTRSLLDRNSQVKLGRRLEAAGTEGDQHRFGKSPQKGTRSPDFPENGRWATPAVVGSVYPPVAGTCFDSPG